MRRRLSAPYKGPVKKIILKCKRGFLFREVGKGRFAITSKGRTETSTQLRKAPTFSCDCFGEKKGCKVTVDGSTARCEADGCSGGCGWVIHVPRHFQNRRSSRISPRWQTWSPQRRMNCSHS